MAPLDDFARTIARLACLVEWLNVFGLLSFYADLSFHVNLIGKIFI
jgi:hypothetical protein